MEQLVIWRICSDEEVLNRVIDLEALDFNWPWSKEHWVEFCEDENNYLFVIGTDKEVSGFIAFNFNEAMGQSHLYKIVTQSAERRLGLAAKLLDKLITIDLSMETIYLEVAISNFAAIAFYKKYNFEIVNEMKRFYSSGENAYAMHRSVY